MLFPYAVITDCVFSEKEVPTHGQPIKFLEVNLT